MTEENTFRKTTPVPTHDSAAGQSVSASTESTVDFAMLEPRDQLKALLQAEMKDKPFSELSSVLFDHREPPSSVISCSTRWRKPAIPSTISTRSAH